MGYFKEVVETPLTVHICSSFTLAALLISDNHTDFMRSYFFPPNTNKIFIQISLRSCVMNATRPSLWHQCSRLFYLQVNTRQFSSVSCRCVRFFSCVSTDSRGLTAGPSTDPRYSSQSCSSLCKFQTFLRSRGRIISTDTPAHTDTSQALKRPSCVHKPLSTLTRILFHLFKKINKLQHATFY